MFAGSGSQTRYLLYWNQVVMIHKIFAHFSVLEKYLTYKMNLAKTGIVLETFLGFNLGEKV